MNQTNSINGLSLVSLDSSVKIIDETTIALNSFSDLQSFLGKEFSTDGNVIVYLDYKVLIGIFSEGKLSFYNNETFDLKFIRNLRLFNEESELFLWRESKSLKGRMRSDTVNSNGKEKAVDANQLLWGTDVQETEDENYTRVFEERGMEIILPFKNLTVDKKQRIAVKTRNYISYNDLNQASYNDSRFVMFTDSKGNKVGVTQ